VRMSVACLLSGVLIIRMGSDSLRLA
jgi:hypothetical protein